MTPTQKQAMEMALEALEQLQGGCTDSEDGTVETITVWCPEVISALRAALAEQADDKADAERYRWLREKADIDVVSMEDKDPGRWERTYLRLLTMEELDAAIDAARNKP